MFLSAISGGHDVTGGALPVPGFLFHQQISFSPVDLCHTSHGLDCDWKPSFHVFSILLW